MVKPTTSINSSVEGRPVSEITGHRGLLLFERTRDDVGRKADRHTDRPSDRQTHRQTVRQTDSQTDRRSQRDKDKMYRVPVIYVRV